MAVWTDFWGDRILPHVIDKACGNQQVQPYREDACTGLVGRVLELGFGSGHNIGLYPLAVTEVVAVEPSETAWRMSAPRREGSRTPVVRGGLDGQRLPYGDGEFDAVLSTFTLCTIADVDAALAEARRVLRPGGMLAFAEHGLAPDAGVQRWQRRLDPIQGAVFGGCHLSRDIPGLLDRAGFDVTLARAEYLPGPGFMKAWGWGWAGRGIRVG